MDPNSLPGLLEPRTLLFFALFVTPGWLMRIFWRRYLAAEPEPIGAEILATVSLSLLSTAVSFLPVAVLLGLAPAELDGVIGLLWLLLAVVILPVAAAHLYVWYRAGAKPNLGDLVLGKKLSRRDEASRAEPEPPIPTAVDAVFGSGKRYLVRFSGADGQTHVGYFGERSHSSLFPNEQQIFLEELLLTDEEGKPLGRELNPRLRARGAIIRVAEHPILEVEELGADPPEGGGRHPLDIRFASTPPAPSQAEARGEGQTEEPSPRTEGEEGHGTENHREDDPV